MKHIDGADLQNDNTVIECKQLDLTEVSDDLLSSTQLNHIHKTVILEVDILRYY